MTSLAQQQPPTDHPDPEIAARWERVARRAIQARNREGTANGSAGPLRLDRSEALLIAHDLYMLGEITDAPSLRWDIATLQSALARWEVTVVPDGSLSGHTGTIRS